MKIKSILSFSLIIIILGFSSCSSDSNSSDNNETVITVSTSDLTVSINENPTNGQVIGIVAGTTNQGSVTFSITQQTPNGAFAIDSSTGELTVADDSKFDYETNPTITGIVNVANGSIFENAIITITILDVEEVNIFVGDVNLPTQQEVDDFGNNNYTEITGSFFIGDFSSPNNSVSDLSPLSTINTIGWRFFIYQNNVLSTLDGLDNITSIGGDVIIAFNPALTNIDGLNGVSAIDGEINITENDLITNLDGLSNIITEQVDDIGIFSNNSLINLNGLINITQVFGKIRIISNPSLINIDGLQNITSISNNLRIWNNGTLTDLNGLNNLSILEGDLEVTTNFSLSNLCGLQTLLIGGGLGGDYEVGGNAYNPTQQDIINGNCSL